eukprot:9502514-Pyramimonas_sp.AAC.2
MAKLVLQHEGDLRNLRRDVNLVLTLRADTKLQLALEEGVDKYNKVGEEERDKERDEFKGHPWGTRPDALMRVLIYRMSEALQANESEVTAAIARGQNPDATKKAVQAIVEWSGKVQDCSTIFHAARCFMDATEDATGKE